MMINAKKNILFISVCFCFIFFISSCSSVTVLVPGLDEQNDSNDNQEDSIPVYSYLEIKGNPDIVTDCTPELSIFTDAEDVLAMSFSGNGYDWSQWFTYVQEYDGYNIACGLYGTSMTSGAKTVYVRFKDKDGTIFPQADQEAVSCSFDYQMQELFCIRIEPEKVELKTGESETFTVKGYDLFAKNEVPLIGEKVSWTKPCGVGKLNPTVGLETIYTAPKTAGVRNISAHYGVLGTGAWVEVVN